MTRSALTTLALWCLAACGGEPEECERVAWYTDYDADGFGGGTPAFACTAGNGYLREGGDCDDHDGAVFPGAVETCDQVDNNCDGRADEGLELDWYGDGDGDGYGDAAKPFSSCSEVAGFVANADDCDDTDPEISPEGTEACDGLDNDCDGRSDELEGIVWYEDADQDGYGNRSTATRVCPRPPGFADNGRDCDDQQRAVSPEGVERCDGIDNDCSGRADDHPVDAITWYIDEDRDGYGSADRTLEACQRPINYSATDLDCDDARANAFPGAPEHCDGLDEDCDQVADEDPVDAVTWYTDADLDGFGTEPSQIACFAPDAYWSSTPGDCADLDPEVNPDADEDVADREDDDCDGGDTCWLDGDEDGFGSYNLLQSDDLDCEDTLESRFSGDCADGNPDVNPAADEIPYDGLDNDCDRGTPDDDLDDDGFVRRNDCDDTDPEINPLDIGQFLVDVSRDARVEVLHWDPGTFPPVCGSEVMAGGLAAGDFDGDGWVDLFVPRLGFKDVLLRNNGDGTFSNVAAAWGVDHRGTSNAALFVDLDANGWLDLVVASVGGDPTRLYMNDGSAFTEEGALRGVAAPVDGCAHSFGISSADLNGDGTLDLLLTSWFRPNEGSNAQTRVLTNDGDGFFTDVTNASGLRLWADPVLGASVADLDDDGDMDVVASADRGDSSVWLGNGDGTFVDASGLSDLSAVNAARGADLGDYDKDGSLDWFVAGLYDVDRDCNGAPCSGNRLLANDGAGAFSDVTEETLVADGGTAWGAAFFDLDLDGDLDVFQTNGVDELGLEPDVMRVWRLRGQTRSYEDYACSSGAARPASERGAVMFDFDNDGDHDIALMQSGSLLRLLRNDFPQDKGWLRIQLSAPGSPNPFGVGAVLWVTAVSGGTTLRREIRAGTTFAASGPPEALVGLHQFTAPVYEVKAVWPDGYVQVLNNVALNQQLLIAR